MATRTLFCVIFMVFCAFVDTRSLQNGDSPRHVHISYGREVTEMIITWSTVMDSPTSVRYGLQGSTMSLETAGSQVQIVEDSNVQYIHRVYLQNLDVNTSYSYKCGGENSWSDVFVFQTMPNGTDWSPRLAVFGDMGYANAQSLNRLIKDTNSGLYDAVLHVGDFAYDMDSEGGVTGDNFMAEIQPIASKIPYMTSPGNHESWNNFYHYKQRFTMPRSGDDMYYSFDMGPIHFVSISTEYYYFVHYGLFKISQQFQWLQNDLKSANDNREERPWIILFGHRPMYCSNNNTADCTNQNTVTRVGLPFVHWFAMEPLLKEYNVDMVIWAHEHSYERLWPVYDTEVLNGSYANPYTNPGGPVHIVTGSAGCNERTSSFIPNPPVWSAFRSSDYGYSRLTVHNKTHLYFEQVSDDQNGKVIDSLWLIKTKKQ